MRKPTFTASHLISTDKNSTASPLLTALQC